MAEFRVLLEHVQEPVEQAHQPVAKLLVGPVPLAIPVGVWNQNQMMSAQGAAPSTSYHGLSPRLCGDKPGGDRPGPLEEKRLEKLCNLR